MFEVMVIGLMTLLALVCIYWATKNNNQIIDLIDEVQYYKRSRDDARRLIHSIMSDYAKLDEQYFVLDRENREKTKIIKEMQENSFKQMKKIKDMESVHSVLVDLYKELDLEHESMKIDLMETASALENCEMELLIEEALYDEKENIDVERENKSISDESN